MPKVTCSYCGRNEVKVNRSGNMDTHKKPGTEARCKGSGTPA